MSSCSKEGKVARAANSLSPVFNCVQAARAATPRAVREEQRQRSRQVSWSWQQESTKQTSSPCMFGHADRLRFSRSLLLQRMANNAVWLTALWAKLLRKWEIGKFNK